MGATTSHKRPSHWESRQSSAGGSKLGQSCSRDAGRTLNTSSSYSSSYLTAYIVHIVRHCGSTGMDETHPCPHKIHIRMGRERQGMGWIHWCAPKGYVHNGKRTKRVRESGQGRPRLQKGLHPLRWGIGITMRALRRRPLSEILEVWSCLVWVKDSKGFRRDGIHGKVVGEETRMEGHRQLERSDKTRFCVKRIRTCGMSVA